MKTCRVCKIEKPFNDFNKAIRNKDGVLEEDKSWDIDHIIPTSSARTEDEVIKLNHYTNLQPLCSYYNRVVKR